MGDNVESTLSSEMPYDLRQTYATLILTPILLQIENYRENNDFINWYDKLTMALHININQKLTEEEKKEFIVEQEKCIKILNENRDAYLGKDNDTIKRHRVKFAIKELELWLKQKMQEHNLFGTVWGGDDDGL